MVSQDVVWFESDVEFQDAVRAMRPAARRPGFWAAIFVLLGLPLIALGVRAQPWLHRASPTPAPVTTPMATATLAEVPLAPIQVPTKHLRRKLTKAARREQHAAPAGRLPRRTWPSWASSGNATPPPIAQRPAASAVREAVGEARQQAVVAPAYEAVMPTPAPTEQPAPAVADEGPASAPAARTAPAEQPAVVADDDASVDSVEVEMPADPTPKAKRGAAWKGVLE